ncbi:MAG: SUF system NifU family Fe-S cluster assembly protein [Fusobacteriaceae bacterium]|nr:SUF system NifU family Fe-S cluster assembly protein [Fusobacteriaceae bacterium]
MSLDKLYTNLIMEHNKKTFNKREITCNCIERGHNPNCGDDITVQLNIEEGIVKDAAFIGIGCAISTASSSILMDLIRGKKVTDAERIVTNFLNMIKGEELSDEALDELDEASLLENIKNMPARVKCATLAWNGARVIFEKYESNKN